MSDYLCDDVIVQIFERLPTKSLIRFRSLSKSWYLHISSPDFIRRHRLQYSQKVLVLIKVLNAAMHNNFVRTFYQHELDRVKDVSSLLHWNRFKLSNGARYLSQHAFPFHFSSHAFTSLVVVNSCNGILCLYARCGQNDISLWNPSIRRILMIPTPRHCGKDGTRAFGFGFDPITDDYKIVKISCINYDGIGDSLVYSMKTRIWSAIALPPKFDYLELESCYINGALHWAAYLRVPERREYYIISCNLSTHVFRKIMLPKPSRGIRKPTIVDGHLAVVSLDEDGNNFRIWVMKEYNNDASWHALFKFSYKNISPYNSVMQLPSNGYYFLINNKSIRLEVYNPNTGERFDLADSIFDSFYMETCVESLELLDSGWVESKCLCYECRDLPATAADIHL